MMQSTVLSYFLLTLSALCVVTTALSSPVAMLIIPGSVPDSEFTWHNLLRRETDDKIVRRQSTEGARNETAIEELDMLSWAKETTLKCVEKLKNVTKASNPSGIAICYNLPFLSTKSGVFAADLRLYQVSVPEGEWATVGGDIDVSLMYKGAAVQLRNETSEEAAATAQASASNEMPAKVQEFHFIGQIDKILLDGRTITDLEMQAMLKPNISLIANTPAGTQLSTILSANEATFVNGVFADADAVNQTTTAAGTEFKVPGKSIEIIPIGLYFFGTYLVIACSIFGWGTFERQKFRDQYRMRIAQKGASSRRGGI